MSNPIGRIITAFFALTLTISIATASYAQMAETPATPETDPAATAVVEELHAGLLGVMKEAEALGYRGRYDRLAPIIAKTYDQKFMAEKTLGRHWKQLTDAQKQQWYDTFSQMTVSTYAGRFTGYTGETFETLRQEPGQRDTVMVVTKIVIPSQDDVQLNYRLYQRDGEWRIIDVFMNGTVSELSLRRSEYSSTIKRQSFDELVLALDDKVASLAAEGASAPTAKVSEDSNNGTN